MSPLRRRRIGHKRAQQAELKRRGLNATEDGAQGASGGSAGAGRLDIESARERLIAQVEKHPFWSNKAAKRMRLLDIDERRILIYELTSHCERRDLEWCYEPYRGGLVAGSGPFAVPGTRQRPPSAAGVTRSSGDAQLLMAAPGPHRTLLGSLSQPGSPLHAAGPSRAPDPGESRPEQQAQQQRQRQRRHQLVARQQSNVSPDCQAEEQEFAGAGATRRQLVRRSCSSATASPLHSPPASASSSGIGLSQLAEPASLPGAQARPGEPRPLPSAELVWSIEPPAELRPAPFANQVHRAEVPESSFVKRCHGCQGRGRLKCTSCYGVGYEVCTGCSGRGTTKSSQPCSALGGAGSGAHSHQHQGPGRDSGTVGSMWSNASDSGDSSPRSRLGSGRHEEPGGIASGSSSLGVWTSESCHYCHGAGQKRCWICAGRAYNTCTACAGTGQLRCYLSLNITWTNHRDECVLNNTDAIIPRDRLKLSSGLLLADETARRLKPIASAGGSSTQLKLRSLERASAAAASSGSPVAPADEPRSTGGGGPAEARPGALGPAAASPPMPPPSPQEGAAAQAPDRTPPPGAGLLEQVVRPSELSQLQAFSEKLLEKHWAAYEPSERLLRQRHRVTQIECFLVNWEWKRRRGHFVIYGDERKVYIAKYPFKSICNIT